MNIIKYWKRNFLICELILSVITVLLIILFIKIFKLELDLINSLYDIRLQMYGTISGISGALLGFVITALSILLTLTDNEALKTLKKSPFFPQAYKVFLNTSQFLALTTIVSLFGLAIDKDCEPRIWVSYLIMWSIIVSLFRLARCFWVLENMIVLKLKD